MNSLLNNLSLNGLWITTLIDIILKGTFILIIAFSATKIFKHLSSSTRHFIWSIAFVCILVLPLFTFLLPDWNVSIFSSDNISKYSSSNVDSQDKSEKGDQNIPPQKVPLGTNPDLSKNTALLKGSQTIENKNTENLWNNVVNIFSSGKNLILSYHWMAWLLFIWASGIIILLFRFLTKFIGLYISIKNADEIENGNITSIFKKSINKDRYSRNIRLLQNEWIAVPLSWGLFHPTIILPNKAEKWPADRIEAVLLHELAHLERGDFLLTIIAHFASIFYWFNPLVWFSLRKFYLEREKACDDFVLALGKKPIDYASNLLEIARSLTSPRWSSSFELTMARKKYLEGRVKVILNNELKRNNLKPVTILFASFISIILIIPIAGIQTWAQKNNSIGDTKSISSENSHNNIQSDSKLLKFDENPKILCGIKDDADSIALYLYQYQEGDYNIAWQTENYFTGKSGRNEDGEIESNQVGLRNFDIGDYDNDGKKGILLLMTENEVKFEKNYVVTHCLLKKFRLLGFEEGSSGKPSFIQDLIDEPLDITSISNTQVAKNYAIRGFKIVDVNNDGSNEVIFANGNTIDIYKYNGKTFELLWQSEEFPGMVFYLDVGDADNDGQNELIASLFNIGSAAVYNHKKSEWDNSPILPESIGAYNIDYTRVRDTDNDGLNELLSNGTSGRLNIWKYNDGKYETVFMSRKFEYLDRNNEKRICFTTSNAGDINGDGLNEILISASKMEKIYIYNYKNGSYAITDSVKKDGYFSKFYFADFDKDNRDEVFSFGTILELEDKYYFKNFIDPMKINGIILDK